MVSFFTNWFFWTLLNKNPLLNEIVIVLHLSTIRILSDDEIEYFRNIKLADVLYATTNITPSDVQKNLFFWLDGDPCPQPDQLNATTLEPCPFLKGYDYFQVRFYWPLIGCFIGFWEHKTTLTCLLEHKRQPQWIQSLQFSLARLIALSLVSHSSPFWGRGKRNRALSWKSKSKLVIRHFEWLNNPWPNVKCNHFGLTICQKSPFGSRYSTSRDWKFSIEDVRR